MNNFKEFLTLYDKTYATSRSYFYKNRAPEEVLMQACREGNVETMIDGYILYPELRNIETCGKCLRSAARGGRDNIFEMMLKQGVNGYRKLEVDAVE